MKIRERNGPSKGISKQREAHERSLFAPKFAGMSREITFQPEGCAHKAAWDLVNKKHFHAQKKGDKAAFDSHNEARATSASNSKVPEKKRIRDWLRSFNAHAEQEGFELGRNSYCEEIHNRYRNSDNVKWEVQTNEKAQVYVEDLGLFLIVQILEDTLAVQSLGQLCEEHGYSYEWVGGQQPRLTKKGSENYLQTVWLRTYFSMLEREGERGRRRRGVHLFDISATCLDCKRRVRLSSFFSCNTHELVCALLCFTFMTVWIKANQFECTLYDFHLCALWRKREFIETILVINILLTRGQYRSRRWIIIAVLCVHVWCL